MRHSLELLVDDRTGSLERVVGTLRRRRYSIERLLAEASDTPRVLRVCVTVVGGALAPLCAQLEKLVDVQQVTVRGD